jgi:hypothetical protein
MRKVSERELSEREKRAPSEGERERERESVRVMRKVSVRDFGVLRVWGKKTRFTKFFIQKI